MGYIQDTDGIAIGYYQPVKNPSRTRNPQQAAFIEAASLLIQSDQSDTSDMSDMSGTSNWSDKSGVSDTADGVEQKRAGHYDLPEMDELN